jgi:ankyrin repeat protein
LTIICALGASLDTIEVVYTLFPSAAFDALCECPFSRFPLRVVKFLVEANPAVLDEVDEDDSTVLHHSVNVACVSKEVLTYLVGMNKDHLLSQDNDGWTPLHRACACSELVTPLEILPLLIDKEKAVLRMKDIEGKTPLLVACDSNASLDVIEFLVGLFPCALEIEDNDGRVPLHGACANQVNASLEIIRFLVDTNPAMLEIKCRKKGWLPLHVACFDGMKKSIKFLLEKNPDATMEEDYQGRIPLALYSKRDDADMETLGSLVVDLYHESTKGLDHAGNRPLSVEQYDSLLAHMVRQASSKRARTTE